MVHERRIQMLALLAGAPGALAAMALLWTGGYTPKVQWTAGLLIFGLWMACAALVRERVASPLRTIANLLEAMREGDYSIRGRQIRDTGSLGDVIQQVNAMGATLQAQRLGALEATTLLRKVMEEIDVAVVAFDPDEKLKLVNRAGERMLNQPAESLLNLTAGALNLSDCLAGTEPETIQKSFPGATGRWGVHRGSFREGGVPHQLLVLTDLTKTLREEELQAWQRLVRVLGHEMNNSLTPIKSIAGSLSTMVKREPLDEDWREDMERGLEIIGTRSDSLGRFLGAYARLAKLPKPTRTPVDVGAMVRRIAGLETRIRCKVTEGPAVVIRADADQLEQVLINLIRNAVDASLEAGAEGEDRVEIGWTGVNGAKQIELWVADRGPGVANTANLFVPFFTTKPGGSGIGLVLSRQIVEAHGGLLQLANRAQGAGAEARISLPV